MSIPANYQRVMPYLIIPKAYQFLEFMKKVFDAKEVFVIPRSEGVVMHGEITIGESMIMFADSTADFDPRPAGLFVYVESVDDTYQKAIEAGGTIINERSRQEYGYTFGFNDPFGNIWWPVEMSREP